MDVTNLAMRSVLKTLSNSLYYGISLGNGSLLLCIPDPGFKHNTFRFSTYWLQGHAATPEYHPVHLPTVSSTSSSSKPPLLAYAYVPQSSNAHRPDALILLIIVYIRSAALFPVWWNIRSALNLLLRLVASRVYPVLRWHLTAIMAPLLPTNPTLCPVFHSGLRGRRSRIWEEEEVDRYGASFWRSWSRRRIVSRCRSEGFGCWAH